MRIKYLFKVLCFTIINIWLDFYKTVSKFFTIKYYLGIVHIYNEYKNWRSSETKYKDIEKVRELANSIVDEGNYIAENKDIYASDLKLKSLHEQVIPREGCGLQLAPLVFAANNKTITENRQRTIKYLDNVTQPFITEENFIGKVILHTIKGKGK